jgi:hypothetical protein
MLAVHKRAKDGVVKGQGISIKYVIPETFQAQVAAKKLWIGAYCEGEGLAVGSVFRPSDLEGFLKVDSGVFEAGRWYVFSFKEGETWPWITTYCTSSRVPILADEDEDAAPASRTAEDSSRPPAPVPVASRPSPPKKSPDVAVEKNDADTPPLRPRAADAGRAAAESTKAVPEVSAKITRQASTGLSPRAPMSTAQPAPKSPRRALDTSMPAVAPTSATEDRSPRRVTPSADRPASPRRDLGEAPSRKLPEPAPSRRGSEPVRPVSGDAASRPMARLPPAPRKAGTTTATSTGKSPPRSPAPDPSEGVRSERGQSLPPAPSVAVGRAKRASAAPLNARLPPTRGDRRSDNGSVSVLRRWSFCGWLLTLLQANGPPRRPPATRAGYAPGDLVECVVDYVPDDPTTDLSACVGDVFEVLEVTDSSWLRVQHVDDHEICGWLPVANCKSAA